MGILGNAGAVVENGITGYKFNAESVDELIQSANMCYGLCEKTYGIYQKRYTKEENYNKLMEIVFLDSLILLIKLAVNP